MKHFKYIFLFFICGLFGKAVALPVSHITGEVISKENKLEKSEKSANVFTPFVSKIKKQKLPKKPKAVQVIVPNVSNHVFHIYTHYSEFTLHEVKGSYSLLLHYSHGKRGPPARLS